jgi:rhamnose utilization protein RhaD (predicted bifunctional aldolase and dehydrogenase)/NAD(P)-dependent dehydrogenase (short-subunit alcohol dehydrogenase family)
MPDTSAFPRPSEFWGEDAPGSTDPLDGLVHLSNLLGRETRLVQPGGGNTSIKVKLSAPDGSEVDALLVKGSGTDLRTIGREGFTRLSLPRLAPLRDATRMSDAEMMKFMAGCMLADGPAPSVETPLHSLLPYRVIAHTHDVATMSLTNVSDATAERLVGELFEGKIVYVPYSRPGFPLAHSVSGMAGRIPSNVIGMTLAHHGLVIFGDDVRQCYDRMLQAVAKIEEYLAASRRGRQILGAVTRAIPPEKERLQLAETVLPAVRGALGSAERVILHFDGAGEMLATLAHERVPELVRRGMATPEHLLRAGRLPLWLDLEPSASPDVLVREVQSQIAAQQSEYEAYHARHAAAGEKPLDDWAKVILAPGLGVITAFSDKKNAVTANLCYRATLEAITNAEAIGGFQFIPEADVFEFEHWPLERRKIEEALAKERATKLLPRHVVVVIGGGSGIGKAAAERFAAEGAHVVVADLDEAVASGVAKEIATRFPSRVIGVAADVRDDASLDALYRRTVLEFGGLDCLFYTAGAPPRFAPITEIRREDLQRQLEVHYIGAVQAIGRAATVMRRQGLGGSIVASVSKAAVVPGKEAVAYGGSKAALLQALRVAAVELGPDNIRVNAINADQVETPLFLKFVEERAASRGISAAEQLELYRKRNLMGASLIPADAVADLAVLLASPMFRYTTGNFLTVDGGLPEAFPR